MSPETKAQGVLDEAGDLLCGPRNMTYGDALHDFRRVGEIWAALLDLPLPIPPHTVAAMMTGLKLVRTQVTPSLRDSWVDAAAYAALGHACVVTEEAL